MGKKKHKKSKVRAEFRKRYDKRRRKTDFTREYSSDATELENTVSAERISGKGRHSRKRTIVGKVREDDAGFQVALDVDAENCISGRVLSVHGLASNVQTDDGKEFSCTIRGLLKSLATDLQHVVVAGDYVTIQPIDQETAVIVRVEPRHNQISRTSRKRQQVLVSNIDLAIIVASAAEPGLKPNLIDRVLVSTEKAQIQPIIVINKVDLVESADLQPVIGVWSQLGYPVVLTSVVTGQGISSLRQLVSGKDSVFTGQSGVGKSSILNVIQPGLDLRVSEVSSDNLKGRHTTTAARLIPLDVGGHLIDTPGIRQFQLWDVIPEEVPGFFRDIRPFENQCRFPDCSHMHEDDCNVKWAVADGKIDVRRYESYCQIRSGD